MDNSRLNETFYTYATSNNYEGAIMLTAEWGAGKSYYLHNELIPFLDKKNVKTLVVSLHGLKSDFEISKALYVEYLLSKDKKGLIKNKALGSKKKKCAASHSSFAVKTIVKGVASFFNVDLSCSEKDLEKLYNSIDLSNTLVVFEDVERSKMEIDELLAFINNLVEYDRVKVILITHETELKRQNEEKYKAIKEKTVGDTLQFIGDPISAVDNMLNQFFNEKVGEFFKKQNVNSALSLEIVLNITNTSINLRSILFGIEKFREMMSMVDEEVDEEFEKSIFISCLSFVHKYRKDNTIVWKEEDDMSTKLSSHKYPLHKFTYDYIISNVFDKTKFLLKEKEYKEYQLISKAKNDLNNRLSVLYNCYLETEEKVKEVIVYIRDSLKKKGIIPKELYFKIANYLVYVKYIIEYEEVINECLDLMLLDMKDVEEEQFEDFALYGGISLNDQQAIVDYDNFKERASAIVRKNKMDPLGFSYQVSDVDSFCEAANKSRDSYFAKRGFAVLLNIDRLVDLMKDCSSFQLNSIRGVFINIYSPSNIKEFFYGDKDKLEDLYNKIKDLESYNGYDAIQKNQIRMFKNNLNEIIIKLDRGY